MCMPTFPGLALKSESSVVDLLVSYLGMGLESGSTRMTLDLVSVLSILESGDLVPGEQLGI